MTREQLLELLLRVAECAEKMDNDVKLSYGVPGHFCTTPILPWEIRQKCPDSDQLTLKAILSALRPTSTSLERDVRPEEQEPPKISG